MGEEWCSPVHLTQWGLGTEYGCGRCEDPVTRLLRDEEVLVISVFKVLCSADPNALGRVQIRDHFWEFESSVKRIGQKVKFGLLQDGTWGELGEAWVSERSVGLAVVFYGRPIWVSQRDGIEFRRSAGARVIL